MACGILSHGNTTKDIGTIHDVGTMKFGIWFTTVPTAVISTYLTDDLVAVDTHSDFVKIDEWLSFVDKIDFCIVTIMNYKGLPGDQPEIRKFVNEMQSHSVDVYLSFNCLLGPAGGYYKRLRDFHGAESTNWICPADETRIDEIWLHMDRICSEYKPTGVLLWHATYPSENFCYGCDDCLSEYGEFDIDKRSTMLTKFLRKIRQKMNEKHPHIRVAIEVDVEGGGNIEYQYGINLKKLKGVIDDVFFHVLGNDEKTLKRVYQLSTEAKKYGIIPKFYVCVLHKEHFKRVHDRLSKSDSDIVVYSPNKEALDEVVVFFLINKWEKPLQRFFDIGTAISALFLVYEVVPSFTKYSLELSVIQVVSILLAVLFSSLDILHRKGKLVFLVQYLHSITNQVRYKKRVTIVRR